MTDDEAMAVLTATHPEIVEQFLKARARYQACTHPKMVRRQRFDTDAALQAKKELDDVRETLVQVAESLSVKTEDVEALLRARALSLEQIATAQIRPGEERLLDRFRRKEPT